MRTVHCVKMGRCRLEREVFERGSNGVKVRQQRKIQHCDKKTESNASGGIVTALQHRRRTDIEKSNRKSIQNQEATS